ncbi:MAG: hypothetical protein NVS2B2_29190 [Ktedonobacteraceae bacterium]
MDALFEILRSVGSLLGVVGTLFWVWMLIDCLNRAKVRPQRVWLFFLLFFTGWFGALIYFFVYAHPVTQWLPSVQKRSQPSPQKAPVYYTLPTPAPKSYQEYQQGYQSQSVPSPAPMTPNSPYQQQPYYPTSDYEEPHATYPEMPQQQQQ